MVDSDIVHLEYRFNGRYIALYCRRLSFIIYEICNEQCKSVLPITWLPIKPNKEIVEDFPNSVITPFCGVSVLLLSELFYYVGNLIG